MEQKKGMFIIFEGVDGSGKSTQLIELIKRIENLDKYQDIVKTHEPWKSKEIKKKLAEDKDAYSDGIKMARLYIDDRINHSEEIDEFLSKGYFVLCDRFKLSTCAYQWTQGVDLYKLLKMHEYNKIITPDLNIFIDVPVEDAIERLSKRGVKEKFEDWKFQRNLASYYKSLISREDAKNLFGDVAEINGRGSVDEVAERVRNVFDPFYNSWKERKH